MGAGSGADTGKDQKRTSIMKGAGGGRQINIPGGGGGGPTKTRTTCMGKRKPRRCTDQPRTTQEVHLPSPWGWEMDKVVGCPPITRLPFPRQRCRDACCYG